MQACTCSRGAAGESVVAVGPFHVASTKKIAKAAHLVDHTVVGERCAKTMPEKRRMGWLGGQGARPLSSLLNWGAELCAESCAPMLCASHERAAHQSRLVRGCGKSAQQTCRRGGSKGRSKRCHECGDQNRRRRRDTQNRPQASDCGRGRVQVVAGVQRAWSVRRRG